MKSEGPRLPAGCCIVWLDLNAIFVNGSSTLRIFYGDGVLSDMYWAKTLSKLLVFSTDLKPLAAHTPRISRGCAITISLPNSGSDHPVPREREKLIDLPIDEIEHEAVHGQTSPTNLRGWCGRHAAGQQEQK